MDMHCDSWEFSNQVDPRFLFRPDSENFRAFLTKLDQVTKDPSSTLHWHFSSQNLPFYMTLSPFLPTKFPSHHDQSTFMAPFQIFYYTSVPFYRDWCDKIVENGVIKVPSWVETEK